MNRLPRAALAALVLLAPIVCASPAVLPYSGGSTSSAGSSSISADGRWVALLSSTAMVAHDTANRDVYVIDRQTGAAHRLSEDPVSGAGGGNGAYTWIPTISPSGRVVAFRVNATKAEVLAGAAVANPGGGKLLAFVDRDTDADGVFDETDAMRVVVLPNSGDGLGLDSWNIEITTTRTASISGDDRYIAFSARQDDGTGGKIVLHDRDTDSDGVFDEVGATATTNIALVDNGFMGDPLVSRDGSTVAISVDGDSAALDSMGFLNVHFYSIGAGTWSRIVLGNVNTDRALAGLSGDGRYALYTANTTGYAARYDRQTDTEIQVDRLLDGSAAVAPQARAFALTPDARYALVATEATPVDASGFLGGATILYDLQAGTGRALQYFYGYDGRLSSFGAINTSSTEQEFRATSMSDDASVIVGNGSGFAMAPGDYDGEVDVMVFTGAPQQLQLTVGDAPEAGSTGGDLYYPITIHNASAEPATLVELRATGPSGSLARASSINGVACVINTDGTAPWPPTWRCPIGTLAAGATVQGSLRADPGLFGPGQVLRASLIAERPLASASASQDTGSGTVSSDVAASVTLPTKKKHKGDPVKISFALTNLLPSMTAQSVSVVFTFNLAFKVPAGTFGGASPCSRHSETTILCAFGNLASGTAVLGSFPLKFTQAGTLTVTMQSGVYGNYAYDRNPANDTATATKRIYR